MPEMTTMETPRNAGFVQRGSNYARKQKRMEEEEREIARLEAEARGEEFVEQDNEAQAEPNSEGSEATEVQASSDTEQEEANTEAEAQEDADLSAEEKSFKKRYGDLRRHMQEKEKEWKEKFESVTKLAERKNIIPPKSDEDIEAWAKQYPDVAGIVETIASKKAQELFSKAEERLKNLDEIQAEVDRKKAEQVIRDTHEDFDDLRGSDDFHNWAEAQPKWVKDALYENFDDPASVIRVIDLYKVDQGKTPSAKRTSAKNAAKQVGRGLRTSVDVADSGGRIKESDVAKMSAKEFEQNEEAITKAMRSGKFIYDLSGNAR